MFGELLKAVLLIPSLVALLKQISTVFKDTPVEKIKEITQVFTELKAAKTKEERLNAAKKIQDLIAAG